MEHHCPACQIPLTRTVVLGIMGKFLVSKEPAHPFTLKGSSPILPFVCSQCGLTQWYVDEPDQFQ